MNYFLLEKLYSPSWKLQTEWTSCSRHMENVYKKKKKSSARPIYPNKNSNPFSTIPLSHHLYLNEHLMNRKTEAICRCWKSIPHVVHFEPAKILFIIRTLIFKKWWWKREKYKITKKIHSFLFCEIHMSSISDKNSHFFYMILRWECYNFTESF